MSKAKRSPTARAAQRELDAVLREQERELLTILRDIEREYDDGRLTQRQVNSVLKQLRKMATDHQRDVDEFIEAFEKKVAKRTR